jgi:hypothetical protein
LGLCSRDPRVPCARSEGHRAHSWRRRDGRRNKKPGPDCLGGLLGLARRQARGTPSAVVACCLCAAQTMSCVNRDMPRGCPSLTASPGRARAPAGRGMPPTACLVPQASLDTPRWNQNKRKSAQTAQRLALEH